MNSKRHAVCDGTGRPISIALTEGQRSDYDGARLRLADLAVAKQLLADKGYDADWFRDALAKRKISASIPARAKRSHPAIQDVRLYKQRHMIENMVGRLKDWRRIAMRYDRCAHTVVSAICIATTVIFWLSLTSPDPGTIPDLMAG